MKNDNLKFKHLFSIFVLLSLCLVFFNYIGFLQNQNLKITDTLYGNDIILDNIVIIGIDDKSINKLGRWPWNRDLFADVLDELNESKIVAFDIGFYEYEDNSNSSDDSFVLALEQNQEKVVLGCEYTDFEISNLDVYGKASLVPIYDDLVFNLNLSVGYMNVIVDGDGISRAVNLNVIGDYDSFAEEIYTKYLDKEFVFDENRFLINFAGPAETFPIYSYVDVLENRVDKDIFNNKIVLIGATAGNLHDDLYVPSSRGNSMSGVEVHANILQTMLLNNDLNVLNMFWTSLIIVMFCATTVFVTSYFKNLIKSAFILFLIVIFYLVCVVFMFENNLIMNVIYIPLTVLLTYGVLTIYFYKTEEKGKKALKNAFGKYVSPVLVDRIIKDASHLKLGGERKKITVLFSDIADFTSISEKLSPEDLVALLNEYLTEMTKIILKRDGVVDKFIGDAVMAFWGAPLDMSADEQIDNACNATVEMFEKLDSMRKKWNDEFGVDVNIRVGLNFGDVIVGNMGSESRFDYTAMGDAVNLASRLESINKAYKTRVMVSESVYLRAKSNFKLREIDLVRVKGKKKPSKIFELILDDTRDSKFVKKFEKGFKCYMNRDFDVAFDIFSDLVDLYDDDTSKMFLVRIEELKKANLDDSWDGVFTMKSK